MCCSGIETSPQAFIWKRRKGKLSHMLRMFSLLNRCGLIMSVFQINICKILYHFFHFFYQATEIKKNIRKFNGFAFEKVSLKNICHFECAYFN